MPPLYHHHHVDYGSHHGYLPVNGLQQLLPGHRPPPSVAAYEQHQYMTHNVERRIQGRATQACKQCRQRKQKCEEGSPCSFCKENSLSCQYHDTSNAITNKDVEKLLKTHADSFQHLNNRLESFDLRLQEEEMKRRNAISDSMQKPEWSDHRTAPQILLLLWRSVDKLLKEAGVAYRDSYVMEVEDRGVIQLHARGEGIVEYNGTQPGRSALPDQTKEFGENYGLTPPEGLWNTGFTQIPNSDIIRSSELYTYWGGLKADNTLDLDSSTINRLYHSYLKHIHIMHPFLDETRLRRLVDNFIKCYCEEGKKHRRFAIASDSSNSDRLLKHQRSNGETTFEASDGMTFRSQRTERSPANAIVYLVLALGKVCSHQGPLPLAPTAGARNVDVIPGLAYYAKAVEILGDQGDANELAHAQMFILAGLYKGQLARVKDSMSWYTKAGRAISNLLDRQKLYNDDYWTAHGDVQQKTEQVMIVLAAWTCLQLESDIRADLPLPPSGIQNFEHLLPWPAGNPLEDNHGNIMFYYNAQLFLRKRLNQMHQELYGQDCLSQSLEMVRETLRGHGTVLDQWRKTLPARLKWNDSDPPSTDILAARLRAKYWGAQYIGNRLFLDYALNIMSGVIEGRQVKDIAKDSRGFLRNDVEIHLLEAIEGIGRVEIWNASKRCVHAAMQSTVALDGVPDRLVVTNIHGTAHAQFGNMLVLSATYFSRVTTALVPKELLQALLERTITFLRRLSPISPTSTTDCIILDKIYRELFQKAADATHI